MNIIDIPKSWGYVRVKINDIYSIQTFSTWAKSSLDFDKDAYFGLKAELERDKPRKTYLNKYRSRLTNYYVIYTKQAQTERFLDGITKSLTFDEAIEFINNITKIKVK